MRGRGARRDYGWTEVQAELAMGVHPAVAAARLGEPESYIRDVADQQGWPIAWDAEPKRATFAADPEWLDS